jgi:glycosyltransferase involved in cell wall biosynthesis
VSDGESFEAGSAAVTGVSIVTAAFGESPYLESALRSALGQTHADFEIVVADDSSSAATRSTALALGDARMRYVARPSRLGPAENHRRALLGCRGELVALLNQDDLWEPRFLEVLVGELRSRPEAELAFCDHWIVDADGSRLHEESDRASSRYGRSELRPGLHLPFFGLLLAQSIPLAMGAVFRNRQELFEELPAASGGAYDLWLTYLFARSGRGAVYVPDRLSSWRRHLGQLSGRPDPEGPFSAGLCWETVGREVADPELRKRSRARAVSAYRSALGSALRARSGRHALRATAALARAWLG